MKKTKQKHRTPADLDINEWQDLIDRYKQTPDYAPGAAMRIENTPFTAARYAGGMTYDGASYTYFEPRIPGASPNPDGTPFVAWLMVRDDFLRWVANELKKEAVK